MSPKKKTSAQKSLLGSMWPMLPKPAVAVGKFVSTPGKFWSGCPAADKDKRYLCTVIEFIAMHDFGGGVKGAGFQCKEMGEDGKGSLEPGVASGDVFVLACPTPFCEYYWFANRTELDADKCKKLFPDAELAGASMEGATDDAALAKKGAKEVVVKKEKEEKPPIFDHITLVSSTLNVSGPQRGSYTNTYTCNVIMPKGVCGCSITPYATGDGKAETTSNAWSHFKAKAKAGCAEHITVLAALNEHNPKVMKNAEGEFVKVMGFEEAFPHHVDYVWCRARGIFSGNICTQPLFRKYVRNYEPRAVFPHTEVQFNIVLCIKELQDEEQLARLTALQKEFNYGPCIGVQLDMWTNPDTHVAYGGVKCVTVQEPKIKFTSGTTGIPNKDKKPLQLWAQSECLDFDVFPLTEHTGPHWFVLVLAKKGIKISSILGATPDGAADGQLGMRLIEGLGEKTDTCNLHGLQRSVLFSVGIAGSTSRNPESKGVLKMHNRVAQLKNQTRSVSDGVRNAQLAVHVPLSKVLTTVDTCTTRWGNQFDQVARDNVLRPVIDPVVDTYKCENRGKKDAIVEDDDSNPTRRLGKAMAAAALGLSADAWDKSLEIEAFLDLPYKIKEVIEHKGYVTGAISLYLMHDLKLGCGEEKNMTVKLHPSTAKLEDRDRSTETRDADSLHDLTKTARTVMVEELEERFFSERPSNLRLIQIWMSKQRSAEKWLPESWKVLAKGLYLTALREAAKIAGIGTHSSPPRKKQKASTSASTSLVSNDSEDEEDEAAEQVRLLDPNYDTVTEEAARWADLDKKLIKEFRDDDGIVNEFALMYKVRNQFPLHYIVFKQTASHLPHKGNSEQLFSRLGALSDDNGKMDPWRLGVWTSIGVNMATYMPDVDKILVRYMLKVSKGGKAKLHEDDLELCAGEPEDGEAYYVQAGHVEEEGL